MKISRLLCAFALLTLAGVAAARAQGIQILRATYGVEGAALDVTGQVQSLVNRGQFSFPVNNQFFRGDPAPRRRKGVFVSYLVNGRQFTQEATEGSTFSFRNTGFRPGPGPGPFPPPPGARGEVRFISQLRAPVRVYLINPFGGWQFVSNLTPGARFSSPARPGQRFIVTDPFNRVLREVTAQPGGETVVLR